MSKKNSKLMRVPPEFEDWILDISTSLSIQTGIPHKKTDTMRKLCHSRITTRKGKIDWRLI